MPLKQLQIAVLGYYGKGNLGDERIKHTIETLFRHHKLKFYEAWQDLIDHHSEICSSECLFIGGGGLIINNSNHIAQHIENLRIPIYTIGISANNNNSTNILLIETLARKSEFCLVRDLQTFLFFRKFTTKVKLSPDLTFGEPLTPTLSNNSNKIGISLRKWHHFGGDQYTKKYYRNRLLNHHLAKIGLHYPLKRFWNETKAIEIAQVLSAKCIFLGFSPEDDGFDDDSNVVLEKLSQCELVVAMRLHACIFCTQLGIPFIALNYAPKVRNYMEMLGLSMLTLELNEISQIPDRTEFIKTNSDAISELLLEKSGQFRSQVLADTGYIQELMNRHV